MSQSLRCASCAAPLELENEFAAFIECEFCGVSSPIGGTHAPHGVQMNFGGAGLLDQARKLKEIKQLALSGSAIYAIKLYRETFGGDLLEAKTAVDNIIDGKPVVFTSVQTFTVPNAFGGIGAAVGQALELAQIQAEIQRGNKINAIKLYRETFGGGLAEAKTAVEAMERGKSVNLPNNIRINSGFTLSGGDRTAQGGGVSFIKALIIFLLAALAVYAVVRFFI